MSIPTIILALTLEMILELEILHQIDVPTLVPAQNNWHLWLVQNEDGMAWNFPNVFETAEIDEIDGFECDGCKFKVSDEVTLRAHIQEVHWKVTVTTFECSKCKRQFNSEQNMNDHIEEYHKEILEFHCNKCNFVSDEESKVKEYHDSVHVNEFRSCGEAFTTTCQLSKH